VNATRIFRYFLTLLLLGAALWMGRAAWDHYMASAWTRDGRIKADVVTISADVAGTVTQVLVHDNQLVQKGDILFTVDQARYRNAVTQAQALQAAQQVERGRRSRRPAGVQRWTAPSSRRKAAKRRPMLPIRPAPSIRLHWQHTGRTESGTHRGARACHGLCDQSECACGRLRRSGRRQAGADRRRFVLRGGVF
jgi:hypothetical protein